MKVSISRVKLFKACRRAYQLRYVENFVPTQKAEALEIGSSYHDKLESLYKTGTFEDEPSMATAMALAYKKYIYPQFEVSAAEEWFEFNLEDDTLVGRIDAIAKDGNIVEHKTTGQTNLDEYEFSLMWDEQLLAYMLVKDVRKVYYTICRKPNIRQKQSESDEEFFKRMVSWYDEDTADKIRLVELTKTDDEVYQFYEDLKQTLEDMKNAHSMYRNTCHCSQYGRRCEYSGICLERQLADSYVGFERREEYADNKD